MIGLFPVSFHRHDKHNRRKKGHSSSDKEPVCVSGSEKAPAGTTWIFTDGSQISSCQAGGSADEGDDQGIQHFILIVPMYQCISFVSSTHFLLFLKSLNKKSCRFLRPF